MKEREGGGSHKSPFSKTEIITSVSGGYHEKKPMIIKCGGGGAMKFHPIKPQNWRRENVRCEKQGGITYREGGLKSPEWGEALANQA